MHETRIDVVIDILSSTLIHARRSAAVCMTRAARRSMIVSGPSRGAPASRPTRGGHHGDRQGPPHAEVPRGILSPTSGAGPFRRLSARLCKAPVAIFFRNALRELARVLLWETKAVGPVGGVSPIRRGRSWLANIVSKSQIGSRRKSQSGSNRPIPYSSSG